MKREVGAVQLFRRCPRNGDRVKNHRYYCVVLTWEGDGLGSLLREPLVSPETGLEVYLNVLRGAVVQEVS